VYPTTRRRRLLSCARVVPRWGRDERRFHVKSSLCDTTCSRRPTCRLLGYLAHFNKSFFTCCVFSVSLDVKCADCLEYEEVDYLVVCAQRAYELVHDGRSLRRTCIFKRTFGEDESNHVGLISKS
jgi:hypothetical protein